jgi:hypothetical protein
LFGQEILTKFGEFGQETLIKMLLQPKQPSIKQELAVANKKRELMPESAMFKGVKEEVSE